MPIVIASLLWTGVTYAQSDETKAAARAAATQGVAAEEAGNWAQAIELFTRAEALVHAPPHLLHIARAEAKRGRLIAAQEAYLKITREDLEPSAPRVFLDAQAAANEELPALQQRIPRLKVVLEGGTGTVMLDGAPLQEALVGIEFPIDPGKHELSATGAGTKSAPVKIEIAEGRHEIARLLLEASTTDEWATPAGSESGDGAPKHSGGSKVPAYAAFGVGVAGLAVGTVMMMVNRGKRDDADALCPNGPCPASKRAEIEDLDGSASSAATMSLVGFGVGIVGLGVGAVLLIMGKGNSKEPIRAANGFRSFGLSGTF
jgi:hypothetical protein